jgi:uncharacterized protein (AIM24 family)
VQGGRGDLLLAPALPGDIILIHMDGSREWAIQKQSYMACDEAIKIGIKTQGIAAGCCSGEGFFILKASGRGRLLLNSFGGIMRYDLKPGEVRWQYLLFTDAGPGESCCFGYLSLWRY